MYVWYEINTNFRERPLFAHRMYNLMMFILKYRIYFILIMLESDVIQKAMLYLIFDLRLFDMILLNTRAEEDYWDVSSMMIIDSEATRRCI